MLFIVQSGHGQQHEFRGKVADSGDKSENARASWEKVAQNSRAAHAIVFNFATCNPKQHVMANN
jgi:hypothetical protein